MREALAYTRTSLLLLALALLLCEAAPRQMELLAAGSFPLVVAVRTGRREETVADCQLDPDLGESDPDTLGLHVARLDVVGAER